MLSKTLLRTSKSSIILITLLIIISVIISFVLRRAGDVIQQEIQAEVAPSFWWDIVIQSSKPIQAQSYTQLQNIIAEQQWVISSKVEMNYTLSTSQWPLLVSLRWVDDHFPLYGKFENLDRFSNETEKWSDDISVSTSLLESLKLWRWDDTATLSIQGQEFSISTSFTSAPWTALSVFDGGRQLILPYALVEKLDLLVQWSRVTYKMLITLPYKDEERISAMRDQIEFSLWWDGYRVSDITQSEWVFQSVGQSLWEYLGLISLLFLLLQVCVLIFLWSRIVHENQSSLQIMRIYGLENKTIRTKWVFWIGWSMLTWVVLWAGSTYALTTYLISIDLLGSSTRAFGSYIPVAIWTTLLTLWVSALPLRLTTRTWPLSLLDSSPVPLSRILPWTWAIGMILVVFCAYRLIVGDLFTALLHLGLVVLLWLMVWWWVWWLHTLIYTTGTKLGWRESQFEKWDILRFLTKSWTQSSMISWWCTVLIILLSWTVMTYSWLQERLTWLTAWWDSVFVTNVFDDDLEKIDQLSFPINDVFSVILWRIVSINDVSLQDHFATIWMRTEQQRWFTREFNMTSNPLEEVELTAWVSLKNEWDLSVDEDFATNLQLTLGDSVIITIAGREFPLTVVNTRSSVRDGVRPFFYFQLLESQFKTAPKTSFFQFAAEPERKRSFTAEIVSLMWNNVSFIDTGEIIAEVKSYIDRVWLLLSVLFWLMLAYAMSAIFSLFRYAWIFQKERFDVYELLGAGEKTISSLKNGYINIYILISWGLTLCSFVAFIVLFRWSQALDITPMVILWGLGTVLGVSFLVWLWGRVK